MTREKYRALSVRTVSIVLAVCMLLSTFGFAPTRAPRSLPAQITALLYSGDVMPNGEPESDSAMLFKTYLSAPRNPNDDITLVMNASLPFEVTDDSVQIGTEEDPFCGTIRFNAISDAKFTATKAIFAAISTDAQILAGDGTDFTDAISITRVPTDTDANLSSALFADHVTAGGTKDTLSLNICCLNDGENNVTYAGVIGDMAAGAKVDLIYENDASNSGSVSNIYSEGNVGLICGLMGAGAELSLTLSGTYTNYTVTSNCGAAGGIVGVMRSGAKLILNSSYTDVAAVTANGNTYVPPAEPETDADGETDGALGAKRGMPAEETDDAEETKGEEAPAETEGDEAPAGGEKASASADETPAGGEKAPASADEAPAGDEKAPASDDEAPAGGEKAPASDDEAPAGDEKAPASADEAPAPTDDTSPVAVKPAKLNVDEEPAEGEKAPASDDETPAEGEKAPASDDETPAEGEKAPASDDETPAEGEKAPASGDEAPAEEEKVPASEDETPADGDAKEDDPEGGDAKKSGDEEDTKKEDAADGDAKKGGGEEEEKKDEDEEEEEEEEPVMLRSAGYPGTSPVIDTAALKAGYAGGIVGWADDAEIELGTGVTVTVSGTVVGLTTAGGVFGYYIAKSAQTFEFDDYTVTATLGSAQYTSANVGGAFGALIGNADVTVSDDAFEPSAGTLGSFNLAPRLVHGANGGGVIGFYQADNLSRTLTVCDIKAHVVSVGSVGMRGGLIGRMGNTAAFVELRNVGAFGDSLTGGLIGSMGSGGSFVSVCEYAGLQGSANGGIVGYVNEGALRLQGETRLQDDGKFAAGMSTQNGGQIAYQRGNGLVYAVGTGADASIDNNAGTGWAFYRANANRRDDISDWGEVVRFGGSPLAMSDGVITEDLSAHTVTIGAAVTSMGTEQDFAKTALNIQLNVSGVPASGALRFSGSDSTTLLAGSLAFTDDIDLGGTGLTGLARDNGGNASFTGTLNGGGKTLTLAAGEVYGLSSNGAAVTEGGRDRGAGRIYKHRFNGLLAETGNSTVQNLTVDGRISVLAADDSATWYIGGISACHDGSITLTDCSAAETIDFTVSNDKPTVYVGGAIGQIGDKSGTVTVSGGTYNSEQIDRRTASNSKVYAGGVIGTVYSNSTSQQIDIAMSGLTLAGSYTNAAATNTHYARFGGLIGYIRPNSSNVIKRTVSIQNVTVEGLDVNVRSNEAAGGVLGYQWLGADVTIGTAGGSDGLVIGTAGDDTASPTINFTPNSGSTAAMMGGLVFGATGRWKINDVKVNNATFQTGSANVDFGFVAAQGVVDGPHSNPSALYLEVAGSMPAHYDLSGLKVAGSGFAIFDEVVTYTVPVQARDSSGVIHITPGPITDNGAAIVSLRTTDGADVVMDGSACNTYQNQTAYGIANPAKAKHGNSRYYYNLDTIRAKASPGSAEKLLLWSLNKYAHSTVNSCFTNSLGNTITGTFDMVGISYYPVSANGVTISGATVKFYNEGIESSELVSGRDGFARSTRADTQHDLMHCGILYDAEDLTVNGLTLQGTVGSRTDGSGFLVRGTLCDSVGNYSDITGVTLDGALVRSGSTAAGNASGYAPLLINKVGSNSQEHPTNLRIATVSTANYAASAVAAACLVGAARGNNIQLTFSGMQLDARTGLLGNAIDSALYDAYGTTQSIFTVATLLYSFTYTDANSDGRYNYNLAEDWDGSNPVHHVTYGKEISSSVEYSGITQDEYFDQEVKTNPSSPAAGAYNFNTSSWLPYVYAGYNSSSNTHEIRINQKLASFGEGCGKCDDPYEITDGGQLVSVAQIIRGDPVDSSFELVLPDTLTPNTPHTASGSGSKANDATFSYNGSVFASGTTATTYTFDQVREYLAGAYYSIAADIVIPDANFNGLGAVNTDYTNYECKYAFRGVILGNTHTIENQSAAPLIANSNGAVVKNLRVTVKKAFTVSKNNESDNANLTFRYYGGMEAYGAVIGKVMGGDTFIDGVNVTYDITGGGSVSASGTAARLVPLGGYIGVVVNGGVIFRNMPANAGNSFKSACSAATDSGWLYANPIIGRVLAGYALAEGCSVDNGNKNYEIPVLDPGSSSKLDMTSKKVTVPDGQAVWILGAIINSGAGAASNNGAYPTDMLAWSGYRNYTAARSGASDYRDSNYGNSNAKKPYIVQQYTTGNTRSSGAISGLTVEITGDCTVPKGFRGIGALYKDSNSLRLSVTEVNGKSHTVTLDMRYLEYVDSSAKQFENYRAAANSAGFGLFNTIGTGGKNDAAVNFHEIALAGSIFYDVRSTTGVTTYDWNNYESGQGNNLTSLSAGGLIGYILNKNVKMQNIKLDGLYVEGARYAGGLIGRITTTTAGYSGQIIQCGTGASGEPVTVKGGFSAGGFIGRLFAIKRDKYAFTVTGNPGGSDPMSIVSSGKSLMRIDEVVSMGTKGDNETYRNFAFSAGGLFGLVQTSNSGTSFTLTDYEVRDGSVVCNYDCSNNRNDNGRCGGVIGTLAHSNSDISGILVRHVNVDGFYAGGFIGKSQEGWVNEFRTFADITVDGSPVTPGTSGNAVLSADASAGGIFGLFEIHDNAPTQDVLMTDCSVSNCEIGSVKRSLTARNTKNYTTGTNGAGGLIGDLFLHAVQTVNISDSSVQDCTIYFSSLTSDANNTSITHGAGGMIGVVQPLSVTSDRVVNGHNILISNNNVENRQYANTSTDTATTIAKYCGTVIGWNGNANVKLVGISACGTEMTADQTYVPVGYKSGSSYGPEGYAIFADHDGASTGPSNIYDSMLFTTGDVPAADPYVTVNPAVTIDGAGHILTGDGMDGTTLMKLLDGADSRYDYALAKTGILSGAALTGRRSTFNTELGLSGPDVTFLVIDASEKADVVTKTINSALDLLSDTQYDFTDADQIDGICSVSIKRMARSGNSFTATDQDVSIRVDNINKRFAMRKGFVDNNRESFTLIDVAFFDPYVPTTVAYHLYLPVFVKKVLEFEFNSLALPDTTYRAAEYAGRKQVLENFGTPVTLCFTYTYKRTSDEWLTTLGIGDSLLGNYNKAITLTKYGNVDPLPAGTELVLVDAQTGKPYYMTLGSNFSGTLDLSSFVAADGVTPFSPSAISDRLNLTATADDEGLFVRCAADDPNAQAEAGGYYYRLHTDEDGEAQRYALSTSVGDVAETYYLSIFTDANATGIARYTVDCPTRLPDSYPTLCTSNEAVRRCDLILGKVYTMSITSFSTQGGDNEHVIDRANDTITANMEAAITLNNGSVYSAFVGGIYHTFLVHLTKSTTTYSKTGIVGGPTVSGTYSIDGGAATAYTNDSATSWTAEGGYAQFTAAQSLSSSLTNPANGYTARISANITIDYNENERAIEEQFPTKPIDLVNDTVTGTTVFVKSNIASSPERTAFSGTSVRADDSMAHRYFSRATDKEAVLNYNTKSTAIIGDLSELGINPLDQDIETSALVETVGVLNFRDVKTQSEGYTHLKVTLTLGQKSDGYTGKLNFSEYFDSMTVAGGNVTLTGNTIELLIPKTKAGYPLLSFSADDCEATIPIDFYVKTGTALESANKTYSNYRVTLDVDLVRVEGQSESQLVDAKSNYVVYTNARVIPGFID